MTISLGTQRITKLLFLGLNVFISLLGFFRAYIFLEYLDFYELGLISIVQTTILLVGMSQIGILNGSYRAFSSNHQFFRKTINDFVFSFFLALAVILTFAMTMYGWFSDSDRFLILYLGVLAGVFALVATYANNSLLANQMIKQVNIISLISNGLGYSALLLIYVKPILAVATFLIQPATYTLLALFFHRDLVPRHIFFSWTVLRYLLRLGFIPYLTSLFAYMNLQLERWTIVFVLGIEQLGHYYLAIAFASLFALFPASINSLYFPRMVRATSVGHMHEFRRLFNTYTYILVGYSGVSVGLTILLAPPLIAAMFPHHLQNLSYVYYTLPGLCAITLASPLLVYFNAVVKLGPLLISYSSGTFSLLLILSLLYLANNISLKNIAISDSIVNGLVALLVFCFFIFANRRGNHESIVSRSPSP